MKIIHVKENTNKKKFKAVYNNAIYTTTDYNYKFLSLAFVFMDSPS